MKPNFAAIRAAVLIAGAILVQAAPLIAVALRREVQLNTRAPADLPRAVAETLDHLEMPASTMTGSLASSISKTAGPDETSIVEKLSRKRKQRSPSLSSGDSVTSSGSDGRASRLKSYADHELMPLENKLHDELMSTVFAHGPAFDALEEAEKAKGRIKVNNKTKSKRRDPAWHVAKKQHLRAKAAYRKVSKDFDRKNAEYLDLQRVWPEWGLKPLQPTSALYNEFVKKQEALGLKPKQPHSS